MQAEKKTVLVTGGAGFIGSHLCEALLRLRYRTISLDSFNDFYDPRLKRENITQIEGTAKSLGGEFFSVEGDIRNADVMEKLFLAHRPEIVFHIAAYAGVRPSIENPALYYDVNMNGTVVVLECMKRHGCRNLVFASSSSVYGNNSKLPFSEDDSVNAPISPYAATKKAGELLCHVYHKLSGMSVACLRFFTVYGPRQRPDLAIRKFSEGIMAGEEIPFFGDGSTERDYTYIDDIIGGVLGAAAWVSSGEARYDIFNLGESRTISLEKMVSEIEKQLGTNAKKKLLPRQPGDVERTYADISKARRAFGYDPKTAFEEGIRIFMEWSGKRRS